jgi:Domain of unknown function (DUF4216)
VQNSGVTIVALISDAESTPMQYYGRIEKIWELDYRKFTMPVFKCSWINNRHGVRKDEYGVITMNFDRLGYGSEPFILANK